MTEVFRKMLPRAGSFRIWIGNSCESGTEMAPSPRQQMYIQRLYLYLNMTKPSEQLYLSYAKVNSEGKGIRPSYLIDTVRKLFPAMSVEYPLKPQPPGTDRGQTGRCQISGGGTAGICGRNPAERREAGLLSHVPCLRGGCAGRDLLTRRHFADIGERSVTDRGRALYGQLENSVSRLKLMLPVACRHFCNMVFPCRNGKNSASRLRIWVRYIMQYWKTLQENLQNQPDMVGFYGGFCSQSRQRIRGSLCGNLRGDGIIQLCGMNMPLPA